MKDQTHLKLRGTTYWFRCRVPVDLFASYGKREITFSLRTKDKKEALSKVRVEALKLTQEFSHKRSLENADTLSELSETEIERIAALYLTQILEEDEEARRESVSDHDYRHWKEAYEIVGITQAEQLSRGLFDLDDFEMNDFLESHGIKVNKDSDSFRRLIFELLKAAKKATDIMAERHVGNWIDIPKAEPIVLRSNTIVPVEDSTEALRDYWLQQPAKNGGKKARSSRAEAETMIRKFREMVGDLRPSQVEKKHVVLLKDKMLEAGSSPATINKGRGILAAIFSCAYENQKISKNPFDGMKKLPVAPPDQEKPYTIEEIQTIFNSPIFKNGERPKQGKGEAAYWLPLLGLYTGARLNELCQLFIDDVSEEDGISFLMIKPDSSTGRTVKDKSRRRIPIHPDLDAMGFLDYWRKTKEEGATQLFPLLKTTRSDGKLGDKWGSWWSGYL